MRKYSDDVRAEIYDAVDDFYVNEVPMSRDLPPTSHFLLGRSEPDPVKAAAIFRMAIGNRHDPIKDLVGAVRGTGINIGPMPDSVKAVVPAFAAWFDEVPVMLVSDLEPTVSHRYAVAQEIGGLMLAKTLHVRKNEGRFAGPGNSFADALLYPDTAVQELKHSFSTDRFKGHAEDFGVARSVILRRMLQTRKMSK